MSDVYILQLPATPRQLLRDFPEVASKLFSAENLPVSSLLNVPLIAMVRSKIILRGNSKDASSTSASNSLMQGPCKRSHACLNTSAFAECGNNRTRSCKHACTCCQCMCLLGAMRKE
jgi:hypothetical protein